MKTSGTGTFPALMAALALAAILALAAPRDLAAGNGLLGMSLPGDFTVFAPESPWNTPVPQNAAVSPDSGAMIAALAAKAKRLKADGVKWSVPLFVIDSSACPKRNVQSPKDAFHPSVDPDGDGLAAFPLPDGVWPDPEKDGHMLLVDPARRTAWDLARAKLQSDGSWTATRLAVWDLNGPGYDPPFVGKLWWKRGARGSGMPLIGGLIRPEEVHLGEIAHALAFGSPMTRGGMFKGGPLQVCSPPASRTDGNHFGPEFIPEGARLQLDPALDLDSLGLSREVKVIARAMQVYGMYNCDHAGSFKLYLQNLGPDGGLWKKMDLKSLANIPVDRFRVLDCPVTEKN